jgi:hypothetical protein
MAKRLTDTDKWKKPFLRGLDAPCKLLWFYICDDCDHAGIWHVDLEVAQIRTGEKIDEAKAIEMLGKKIVVFDDGKKWFIPSFIEFQYPGGLNAGNKVHDSVIQILNKYNLLEGLDEGYPSPFQGAKDKDTDKDTDKDKDGWGSGGRAKPLKKAAEAIRQESLKAAYKTMQEEMTGEDDKVVFGRVKAFIESEKPGFAEPYVDAWNIFAPWYGLEAVREITDDRREKIRVRSREPGFDFMKALAVIRQRKDYRGENKSGWKINFNYLIASQKNYTEVIEKHTEH